MIPKQGVLFDVRFLDRHAGAIMTDTAVAVVELVANTWDACASEVTITWPNPNTGTRFSIVDNGKGVTAEMFERRWRQLDYNRLAEEGDKVDPPVELKDFGPRRTYGRNGRGISPFSASASPSPFIILRRRRTPLRVASDESRAEPSCTSPHGRSRYVVK
jgi:Histidine kinase-, DNA gyrase B-, and HSP90-like ATPase